ncbi:LPXTG cell wall anchor domain-containing protein [Leucobacter viscericola]|uniref:LPXTG cell wall anchor domain-containing protein n=1 Tax=Leucobacter viscericola TaxID=2714935 RepID=A0A6G7XGC3_9MICO|nr:SpaA isopeptide-forming pilin-related protein [Leucobacter viscericola]QIK63447.1 LPXTG cell wall anchor domain-containing protein [Leucobacter viscericola]
MVSAGYQHSGAVTSSGDLYMWGYQFNGRLGNGQTSGIGGVQKIGTMKWKQVSAANASTYAVTQAGELYAWGYNAGYRLGLGDTTDRSTPTYTLMSGVKQVSGSQYVAAFVTTGGAVYTAGTNTNAQLGSSGGTDATVAQRWTGPRLQGASEVTVGDMAAGAKAGNTATWGKGMQVGYGDLGVIQAPRTISGVAGTPAKPWVTITTSTSMTDTQARGSKIVFGDPAASDSPAGWQLAKNIDVVTVSGKKYLRGDVPAHNSGPTPVNLWWNDGKNQWSLTGCYTYNFALKIDSAPNPAPSSEKATVSTWFYDLKEAPYAGAATADLTVQQLGGSNPHLTEVGGFGVSGLSLASGRASADVKLVTPNPPANNGAGKWKYDTRATANVASPSGPVSVTRNTPTGDVQFYDDGGGITPPPPGPGYTCDVAPKWLNSDKTEGTVLGYGTGRTDEFIKVPAPDPGLDIVQVSMGAGDNTTPAPDLYGNRPFTGHSQLYTVTSLGAHTLYLDREGNVWGLGLNNYGQVGNGTTSNLTTPVKVLGPSNDAVVRTSDKVTRISAGGSHSAAVTENGTLYQWGNSVQLGIAGAETAVTRPTNNTPSGATFKDVSAGAAFTLALSKSGLVYAWGTNGQAQLGRGVADSNRYPTPLAVPTLLGVTVTDISAGAIHALASTGNRVYGWGEGVRSGNGVTNNGFAPPPQTTPYSIPSLNGKIIRQIEATPDNSYVLTSDTLYAWGSREWGLAMMPAQWAGVWSGVQYTPQIGSLPAGLTGRDITGVFGGKGYTYLTTANDEVYAFGNNRRTDTTSPIGDLGTEQSYWDFPYLEVPAKVPGLSGKGITQIAGGGRGSTLAYPVLSTSRIAYTADGKSYGWGGNQVGQLGVAQPKDVETYVPYQLTIGTSAPIESGTVYFGDPKKGMGLDRSEKVAVTKDDIITEGGKKYFLVKIPKHVVGGVEVYTDWGGATSTQELIGCYDYRLSLYITPDPDPQTAGGEVLVTAYVGAGEETLTGNAVVDISIPAVGNELQLVPGQSLTRLALNAGKATTKVKLREPWPAPTEANGDWKYPDSALAWIPSSAASTSLVTDTTAQVVSNQALTPKPWVRFTPPTGFEVHLWKTGESVKNAVVGMSGSEWLIHPDSTTTPNTPDYNQTVAGFDTEVTNPNTSAPERQKGWFTAELKEGVYWLVETKAPKGFQLMAEPVQFRVRSNGEVQALSGRSGYFAATNDWNTSSWDERTLVVRDPGATPLPKSGSEPWQWVLLFGVLLLAVSGVYVVRRFSLTGKHAG